jgi:hypothetical protein
LSSLNFYAQLGLHTLRLWGITESGRCQCGRPTCAPRSAGKHPIRPAWQSTPPDAQLGPGENLGLRMGIQPSGAAVVALDVDEPEAFAQLCAQLGPLPETLRTETGRGYHLIFQVPPALLPQLRNFVKRGGCDLRAEGGQVVAAPSKHYSGRLYALSSAVAPAWLPPNWFAWLAACCSERSASPDALPCSLPQDDRWLALGRAFCADAPADFPSGGGTWKLALRLRKGLCLPEASALALLVAWNESAGNPRPYAKLERAVRQAAACGEQPWGFARPNKPGSLNAAESPEELLQAAAAAGAPAPAPLAPAAAAAQPEPAEFQQLVRRKAELTATELEELGTKARAKPAVKKLAAGEAFTDVRELGAALRVLACEQPDGVEWSAYSVAALLGRCWVGEPGSFNFVEAWENVLQSLREGDVSLLGIQKTLWSHPAWQGCLAWDEQASQLTWRKPPPLTRAVGQAVTDEDITAVRAWFAKNTGQQPGKDDARDAMRGFGRNYASFNPLQERLQGLRWDGVQRLETWLVRTMGAEPSEFVQLVSAKWLISCVARAMRPGCKADHVLVLQGERGGEGKSTVFELLSLEDRYYLGLSSDLGSKESKELLRGKWIVSLDELASMRRSEMAATLSFLSLRADDYRAAYGWVTEQYLRRCAFGGTVNDARFIGSDRNERRWWPVSVKPYDRTWILENREQLWAEAFVRFERGDDWHAIPWELQTQAQEPFVQQDALEDTVRAWLLRTPTEQPRPFLVADILPAIGLRVDDVVSAKRVAGLLRRLGCEQQGRRWSWVRRELAER